MVESKVISVISETTIALLITQTIKMQSEHQIRYMKWSCGTKIVLLVLPVYLRPMYTFEMRFKKKFHWNLAILRNSFLVAV